MHRPGDGVGRGPAHQRARGCGAFVTDTTAFLGLSHLGIVSSIAWASFDRQVVAVDPDLELVQRLAVGDVSIHEPGLVELLDDSRERIAFSSDLAALSTCSL